ncbi:MAG: MBL fold metallo-hydrolase [Actinobacteria bacterium]|nr:MBL fold metallo-hydrolase [Actinomycetota bacterium]
MNLTTRSDNGPPEPRLAATVVPLRDGVGGLEVLLTIRPEAMRFMGGMAVFPGGALAPADYDPRWEGPSVLSGVAAAASLSIDDPREALGTLVCALREAYEEVGLLLAAGAEAGDLSRMDPSDAAVFLEDCLAAGLTLATDALVPAGRWVTPAGSPIRFDARFFLVRVPDGWEPVPDPREVESFLWVTPEAALAGLAAGELIMAPPTIEMLQRLDAFPGSTGSLEALRKESSARGGVMNVRLSPLVRVVLAPNPGVMTGPGTNSYVVGTGPVVVIDPAVDDEGYLDALLDGAEVSEILITHRHSDHVGGIAALVARTGAPVRAFGTEPAGGIEVVPLLDGDEITAGGATLVALHTPGHASDHLCFLLKGAATLFAGDNVVGQGTAVIAPPDGDMGDYLASLTRMRSLGIDRIYPGHFFPLDGGDEVIDGYLAHRAEREAAILEALAGGPLTPEEIVEHVYTDTDPALHPLAAMSVLAHLEFAEQKGVTLEDGGRWRLVGDTSAR